MKKPEFLGPANAAAFDDADVASAYRHRVPYPPATFDLLLQLLDPGCRVVLDVGCGEGALARPLAPRVDRVDAVDPSAPMLDAGRRAPGGDHLSIRWIQGLDRESALSRTARPGTARASSHARVRRRGTGPRGSRRWSGPPRGAHVRRVGQAATPLGIAAKRSVFGSRLAAASRDQ